MYSIYFLNNQSNKYFNIFENYFINYIAIFKLHVFVMKMFIENTLLTKQQYSPPEEEKNCCSYEKLRYDKLVSF
jgi:hypothetical protein